MLVGLKSINRTDINVLDQLISQALVISMNKVATGPINQLFNQTHMFNQVNQHCRNHHTSNKEINVALD